MATAGEEEMEYESDTEEVKRSLAMRRRKAASDDEEGEREVDDNNNRNAAIMDRSVVVPSDESDGQVGAADFYDEEEELEEENEEYYDEEEIDEEEIEIVRGEVERTGGEAVMDDGNRNVAERVEISNSNNHVGEEDEEGKKENEPFAVPTTGSFYMHDDRFRDNVGGRHRFNLLRVLLPFPFKLYKCLVCEGVPFHTWNWNTFKNIADKWGLLLAIDESCHSPSSFDRAKIQVLTKADARIDAMVELKVGDNFFKVMVHEIEPSFKPNSWAPEEDESH
ncbi:CASC3/Barentsz eIF4AIII binding, putative isoform 6 [Hibiscus syriacus]|uniref:CASC3/Barentsz eIF4AIII binding, putative isoform 6 n=1 Tax=Hibiscus syriacus TaxID=106335 RepID=A0A6A2WQ51_HIBSY|nr:CASC3/Barentsz eIF4AIII binding, putative isoform 6 [Hibiscus syriacus]